MSETLEGRYIVGEDARLRARFFAEDRTTPVAVQGARIVVRPPGAETPEVFTEPQVKTDGIGSYFLDYRVELPGRYRYRGDCAGPTAAVDENTFTGVRSTVL